MTKRTESTTWEIWTYDVWGNARDGFDVNDLRCESREHAINIPVETFNPGTAHAFDGAYPTVRQIRAALGVTGEPYGVDVDGDDCTIYVTRTRDGYPIGELHCTSHESLSPIRRRKDDDAI